MAKTVKSDVIEFPTFDATEMTDQFRAYAEKGVEQSKEMYSKVKDATEEAQKAIEKTFETSKAHGTSFSLKAIEAGRTNAEAAFKHAESLIKASSLSEVIELQSAFLRTQMEAFADQAKGMQTLATKAMEEVSAPVKTAMDKAVKSVSKAA